ncbi:MAG: LysR family transcriptional regulator [Burkholderiaceae bacterium]|nr:LysR family transcriptional regulator [Burkholderiaceae bacterium]
MDALRLTLRQLQIFVAVAQTGSTTAASVQIALSQSATSSAIKELERLLSLHLFDRVGKRLLLNDSGRALLPRALALLDGAAGIEQMSHDGMAQSQSLRIGASTTIGNFLLPRLLEQFLHRRHQNTATSWHSRVVIKNTEAICDAVDRFELDVGLIEGPCHRTSLSVTPWMQDELVVVGCPTLSQEPTQGPVSLKTMRDWVWLLRETGSGTREVTDQLLLPHLGSYRRSIELGSSEAIKHSAAAGLGVACLSHWVVDDMLEAKLLKRVHAALPKITRQFCMVIHRGKQHTPALLDFIDQATSLARSRPAVSPE